MPLTIKTLSLNDSEPSQPKESIVPKAQQLCDDIVRFWKEEPSAEDMELTQLFTEIKKRHPEWKLDERFLKDCLIDNSLYSVDESQLHTYSHVIHYPNISEMNTELIPTNVQIREVPEYGRGLFSKKDFNQGDMILKESPICIIPPMEKLTLMSTGKACTLCGNSLANNSPHFTVMNGLDCNDCSAVWCSKTCKKNDMIHSPLKHNKGKNKLVKGSNWIKFEKFCLDNVFLAAYGVGVTYAKLLLNSNKSDVIESKFNLLAEVSQRIRTNFGDSTNIGGTLDATSGALITDNPEPIWKEAYRLFIDTFPSLAETLNFEQFLLDIGKYNINQVSDQIFFIFSFLNHDCEPNVRYEIDSKLELKLFARKPIKAGEELRTTYVNPLHGTKLRRRELRVNWGFLCKCTRCQKEIELKQKQSLSKTNQIRLSVGISSLGSSRRKSSLRNKRPDLTELLKNGKEFDLEVPDIIGTNAKRRTSVRFDDSVSIALEE